MKKLIVRFLKWYFREDLWRFYSLETVVNNRHVDYLYKDKMLRMRVYFLEKELGISNSFNRAESAHPDDGFKGFEYDHERIHT